MPLPLFHDHGPDHADANADPHLALASVSEAAARRGALYLVAAAMMFSGMALCVKAAAQRLPAAEVAFMRYATGLCSVLIPLALGQKLRPRNYGALFLRGLFGGTAGFLYFVAIAHLPVGIATLLNYSWPMFGALFAFLFLDEPLGVRAALALVVTSIGVFLVVVGGATRGTTALALPVGPHVLLWGLVGMSSAVFSAAAVTTIRSMRRREGSWEIFLSFCLIGSLLTSVPSALHFVTPTWQEGLWILAMGGCSVAAHLSMTYALRDVPAVTAGIILQLTPIATLLLGTVIYPDRPAPIAWLGATLTLIGVTWGTIRR